MTLLEKITKRWGYDEPIVHAAYNHYMWNTRNSDEAIFQIIEYYITQNKKLKNDIFEHYEKCPHSVTLVK